MSSWFEGPPRVVPHRWHGGAAMVEPDHGVELAWPADGAAGAGDVVVMGPRTRAHYWDGMRSPAGCVRMRLAPGRAPDLLGLPAQAITDRAVPLKEFDLDLAELLASVPPGPDGRSRLLRDAAALITGARPEPVHRAARRLHVSERHLRGLFASGVGLPPRLYTQIERVRTVLAHPEVPLPEVAALAGYYDQSHMTAEFRRLMGAPPGAFRAGRWPAPERCGRA
ncbi:helix-turn-helix transcriptional regulator [Catenuloplanes atrovinosus]|uniref:AraC-like DNA-binding protein n=1 Tax=Catenuloplanes atrovinosus TaxID=137266 RepID=A0AAE3YK06_9ACTN|nr:helix-turn-helix transcriptional regulator [Catenuloplanes atrovinosus]MDR7275179.1 AraC-like DNA-binding protein [Catenuloplanes atrovinosus]